MSNDLIPNIVIIDRVDIRPNDYNPNEMDKEMFNELVENIETLGFVQPVLVAPLPDGSEYAYQIIDGEHRFDGLGILGIDEIPCIVKDVDEDTQKFQTVKMNRLRGKFNQKRFTALVKDLMERYSFEEVAQRMAFTDPTELEGLIENARETIEDPDMRKEFDRAKDDIKTVDDLSNLLNRLFTQFGDTVPANFMILDFGGKRHIWVRMGKKNFGSVQALARDILAAGYTFDSFLMKLLSEIPIDKFIKKYENDLDPVPEDTETIEDI